jgi:hypothetical protein
MSLVDDLKTEVNKDVSPNFKPRYINFVASNLIKYEKVATLINLFFIILFVALDYKILALLLLLLWFYALSSGVYKTFKGG